jgi:pyrroline-5-carboxylate reductase
MGGALVTGLLRAGWTTDELTLAEARPERAEELRVETGCRCEADPAAAIGDRDVIVVAVKPQGINELLEQIAGSVSPDQVLVALVAGVPIALYEAALPGVPIVRTMPNTPALVGEGVSAVAGGTRATQGHIDAAKTVLAAVGGVEQVSEAQIDAVTAVSGSGPAYAFLLAEAMIEAGVAQGLERSVAEHLVKQTIKGAGALMIETGRDAGELREQVTSPGGTTAAALATFEAGGFRELVAEAVKAAAVRSRELGEEAGGRS